jgi:hypothetical protein
MQLNLPALSKQSTSKYFSRFPPQEKKLLNDDGPIARVRRALPAERLMRRGAVRIVERD